MADYPLYDDKTLPGGPWFSFQPRKVAEVYAMRVLGEFDFKDPKTGDTTHYVEGWILQHADGSRSATSAEQFAAAYETLE